MRHGNSSPTRSFVTQTFIRNTYTHTHSLVVLVIIVYSPVQSGAGRLTPGRGDLHLDSHALKCNLSSDQKKMCDGDTDLLVECPDDLGVEVAPAVVCLLPFLDLGHHWTLQRDLSKN